MKAVKDCYSLAFYVNNDRNKVGIDFNNSLNLFSCPKTSSSISTTHFLTDVLSSKLDKPPTCLLLSLSRLIFFWWLCKHIFLVSNLGLPCYVSDPLCTALSTVDKKEKFPATFQQPFPISHTNIFLLFNSHKQFFYCSFIVILIVLP